MQSETERLNYAAVKAIRAGDYWKAIDAVAAGSGEVGVLALLSVARELEAIREAIDRFASPKQPI